MAVTFGCAFGGGGAGEPQIRTNQRQQCPRGDRNRVQLRLDKAFAGMYLRALASGVPNGAPAGYRPSYATHAAEMAGRTTLLLVLPTMPARGGYELRVGGVVFQPVPTVMRDPTGGGQAALALVIGVATRHCAEGLQRDGVAVHHGHVLAGRNKVDTSA